MRTISLNSRVTKGALAVAFFVATAAAGWFGWCWWNTSSSSETEQARAREQSLHAAEHAVRKMTTMNHKNVESGLAQWRSVTTGAMREEITNQSAQYAKAIRSRQAHTNGKVVDSAVTELDSAKGKASVILSMSVTSQPPKGKPTTKRERFRAGVERTSDGWKLSTLNVVPVRK